MKKRCEICGRMYDAKNDPNGAIRLNENKTCDCRAEHNIGRFMSANMCSNCTEKIFEHVELMMNGGLVGADK